MSFFKKMLGDMADDPTKAKDDDWLEGQRARLEQTIDQSRPIYQQCALLITKEAKKISGNSDKASDNHLFATALIFAVVWQLVGWAWSGVRHIADKRGEQRDENPVVRLWEIMRATFGSADEKECKAEIAKLHKKWGVADDE